MVKYHVYANKTHMHYAWCQEWIMYNNVYRAGRCFFHLPFLLDVHLCIVQYNYCAVGRKFFDSAIIVLITLRGRAREEQVCKTSQFK